MNLQKKDMALLAELDTDCRRPLSTIAKKVGISPELAAYKMKQLEKKGIITGYMAYLNVAALGYNLYKIYIRLQNISRKEQEEMVRKLCEMPEVGLVGSCTSTFDLDIGIVGKSLVEFHRVSEAITKEFGRYIRSKEIAVNIEMWQMSRKYLGASGELYYFWDMADFNSDDLRLIEYLVENGRAKATEAAAALGLSRRQVSSRIKHLQKEKVLLGFRCNMNISKLGLSLFKILIKTQSLTDERQNALLYYLRTHRMVSDVVKSIGSWEIEVIAELESSRQCHEFILAMKEQFSDIISDTSIMEILDYHKYIFAIRR